ncbi:PRC-barrel domain-containing protein [Gimesia aquarii]|uniref:PRC-barrel domain protein n=1 Tax=Gimesia aquarii TaxID=2527964 RepID=A0A517WX89_9PLAN|nr:PRC-barrel domain-containing protein [Gimesia aquarii]QDU09812.1 PRC-barrel domain protein [Gimesia aquarii]
MNHYAVFAMTIAFGISTVIIARNSLADNNYSQNRLVAINYGVTQAGNLDDKTTGANIRASKLLGMNILNSKGKNVGEINDILLNATTGKVNYVAVTYGGLLGVGSKMFAIPYKAFQYRQNPNDKNEYALMLNVTQKQLEGAKGFDDQHWPNFADSKFTHELDHRYGVKRNKKAHDLSRSKAGQLDDKTTGANIRFSQMTGMNIYNSKGKNVGEINDIVLNASTGKINYAAVTYGGFLGVGNKMFAVPFKAFKVQRSKKDQDKYLLVLNVTEKQLEGAKGFDEKHWPNFADPDFNKELFERYGVKINVGGIDVEVDTKNNNN